jgi:hypothetical protein
MIMEAEKSQYPEPMNRRRPGGAGHVILTRIWGPKNQTDDVSSSPRAEEWQIPSSSSQTGGVPSHSGFSLSSSLPLIRGGPLAKAIVLFSLPIQCKC